MAYAALVSLEQTIDLLLNPDQYSISVAVNEEIRSIREYVMVLTSFLEDFPDKARRLEAKIRELANDTEVIIEDFMWKQNRARLWNIIEPSRSELLQQLRKDAEAIGSVVGEIMDGRAVGNSASAVSSSGVATTRQKDVVVGLDGDLITIKDRLCGISSKLQVIPIVGMGGIGKTTLARNAYDDVLIVDHFHIRAWVTVSQDYSARAIFSCLIDSMKLFIYGPVLGLSIDEQAITVYQTLKGRRYLIVMDDVWSTKVWDDLRKIFPEDGNGSRIMLTTRLSDVAAQPDFHSPLYTMRFMDDHQSWGLLRQKVGSIPSDLEDVGIKIARRCAGLPLAVVLVAGVLSAVDMTRASWEEIAKTRSPAVELELGAILSLSYTHLPHHLRPCLLFIGSLPEDRIIHASTIIRLLVAENFLKHRNICSLKSLEEVAEEYLEDLVKRNLVIVNSRKSDGKIKTCSVHDMVRDMCIRKAREEQFLRVMDEHVLPQGLMNDRRIILSRSDNIYNIWCPTILTILCFGSQDINSWLAFLSRSRLLRVLVVGLESAELPAQVFELFHLRYLAVFHYHMFVPSAISNLVNLQTLIIRPPYSHKSKWTDRKSEYELSLPTEIWRMRQLRHLLLYIPHMLPPPPPDSDGAKLPLENIQTLFHIKNLVWDEKILRMIPNVKRLGLVYTCIHDYGLHRLKYFHQLEKLEVLGHQNFCWQGKNPSFPRTLKKLSLVGGGFPWEDMAIIGALPNLQVLKLLDKACHGETWETTGGEFPQLLSLLIDDDSSLRKWIIQRNSFPRLRWLVLRSCWNLSMIPEHIGDIPSLELIKVHGCQPSLVLSAEKIKEDQQSYGNDSLQVRIRVTQPIRQIRFYNESSTNSHF